MNNESTQDITHQQQPWERDSYNKYIARSSLFDTTDASSQPPPECDATEDLAKANFSRAIRSTHGSSARPNGGLNVASASTYC